MSLRVLSAGSSAGTLQKPCRFAKERFGSEQGRQQKREGRAGPHARDVGTASAAGAPPGRCRGFAPLLLSRLGVQEPPPHAAPARKRGASICTQNHAGVVLRAGSQAGAPPPLPSGAETPRQVPGAPLVPVQQPKARLSAPIYPAQRPKLVGISRGRLGSTGARGRGSGWEMQEAGLVSLSGVQINRRFRSLGAAEAAPVSLKNQKSTKKQRGAGRKEIRKAKNKAKSSSCGADRRGKGVRLVPPAAVPGSSAAPAGAGWWRWEVMLAPQESRHPGLWSPRHWEQTTPGRELSVLFPEGPQGGDTRAGFLPSSKYPPAL